MNTRKANTFGMLERSNLAADIASLLRRSIVKGELGPGTRLIEAEIAQQLGVSRGPLREAFRILETEGLLESYPGRGSFVAEVGERDIREVYSLRGFLEERAIRMAAENATAEDLQELERILASMFEAAKQGDSSGVQELDFQFHRKIWEIADHHLLREVLEGLTTRIRRFLAVQTELYGDLAEGISDHQQMLSALKNGDEDKAAEKILHHLQEASDVVTKNFQEQQARSSATTGGEAPSPGRRA